MNITFTKRAVNDLDALERSQPKVYERVLTKIELLEDEPKLGKPLVGPLRGKWSLRIGDFRVVYQFHKSAIVILTVNHRREVYRER